MFACHAFLLSSFSNGFLLFVYNPSREFFNVLKETDANIELIIERLEKFYNHDGKTVYVFASDHGMTDWGLYCFSLRKLILSAFYYCVADFSLSNDSLVSSVCYTSNYHCY